MLVLISLVFLSCFRVLLFVLIIVGSCLWLFWSKNEPQQSFQNPQKDIILLAFYHMDNGYVVCLSIITLSMNDTSSRFFFVCIFHPCIFVSS